MNAVTRTLFFLSAFAPAILMAAITHVYKNGSSDEAYGWIGAGGLACIFPFFVIKAAATQAQCIAFTAKKVESQDWLVVVFVVSYFTPLITSIKDLDVFALLALVAAIVLATLDAIPCHPVLHAFRYRFYKVEGTNGIVYTLISNRRLLSASDIKSVRQLSHQLLMVE